VGAPRGIIASAPLVGAANGVWLVVLFQPAGVTALDDRSGPPGRHRLEQRFNSKVGPMTHWEGLLFHCLMD